MRTTRRDDERAADHPDLTLRFPKGYDVSCFRWLPNSRHMYVANTPVEGKTNGYLSLLTIKPVANALSPLEELELSEENDTSDEVKPEVQKVNFESSRDEHTFVKLPLRMLNFCVNDRSPDVLFGTNLQSKYIFDFRAPTSTKFFQQKGSETTKGSPEAFDVTFNGRNCVLFSGKKFVQVFDIRKEGESLLEVNLPGKVGKVVVNPFEREEFVAQLDDYLVRVNFDRQYECLGFG